MVKVKSLGRRGVKVGEVKSSKGDNTYDIYDDNGRLTCECIGFSVRKSCRHIKEYKERRENERG